MESSRIDQTSFTPVSDPANQWQPPRPIFRMLAIILAFIGIGLVTASFSEMCKYYNDSQFDVEFTLNISTNTFYRNSSTLVSKEYATVGMVVGSAFACLGCFMGSRMVLLRKIILAAIFIGLMGLIPQWILVSRTGDCRISINLKKELPVQYSKMLTAKLLQGRLPKDLLSELGLGSSDWFQTFEAVFPKSGFASMQFRFSPDLNIKSREVLFYYCASMLEFYARQSEGKTMRLGGPAYQQGRNAIWDRYEPVWERSMQQE